MSALPGLITEWEEFEPLHWRRKDHPEDGAVTLSPGVTFPFYFNKRATEEGIKQTRDNSFATLAETIDLLTRLKTATPAQIDTWLNNNMTTLAQARNVFSALLKVLATRL